MKTDYSRPAFAQRYARSRQIDEVTRATWVRELAAHQPRPGGVCLDLGSGVGRFWPVLREAWSPGRILAVDASVEMLSMAEGADVVRVCGDLDQLPLAGGSVDSCWCSMVLHYSSDLDATCRRLFDVVAPGGVLGVRTATQSTISSFTFLTFFPTALAAERRVMPYEQRILEALHAAGFSGLDAKMVVSGGVRSYRALVRQVWGRGFPSLQFVPVGEFLRGMTRLVLTCAIRAARRTPLDPELSFLVTGRRL
ncbi:class I SAM-dependent methyltransferase [Promicromonospora sp. NPDC023805]|uniref:class I SAM-dependent methyltransferase n=1 Tax=Promicromonospora sp. NPDC023805 TaxID=3154696 RepID=UPI0033D87EEF